MFIIIHYLAVCWAFVGLSVRSGVVWKPTFRRVKNVAEWLCRRGWRPDVDFDLYTNSCQSCLRFVEVYVTMQVSVFSTWEKELHKIVFDRRYLLLPSKERKQIYEQYVKERADDERKEKVRKLRQRKDDFRQLLTDAKLRGRYVTACWLLTKTSANDHVTSYFFSSFYCRYWNVYIRHWATLLFDLDFRWVFSLSQS